MKYFLSYSNSNIWGNGAEFISSQVTVKLHPLFDSFWRERSIGGLPALVKNPQPTF
ncbi:hypothetical protein VTL71DRAFT_6763 [Oculimacula yallundae]|uniref:Uncharacterized protein n=1 Tax=Oculimacula yallundae TaxID=86028 RepID=A0ABR4BY04_9HELO